MLHRSTLCLNYRYGKSNYLDRYMCHKLQRSKINLPPKPLTKTDVQELIEDLRCKDRSLIDNIVVRYILINLLDTQVPPGVDEAAKIKAEFLYSVVLGKDYTILKDIAWNILLNMQGGYNIEIAINMLKEFNDINCREALYIKEILTNSILVFDYFYDILEEYKKGNLIAKHVMNDWANNRFMQCRTDIPDKIPVIIFKVPGEVTTDDLSPAEDVSTRSDIPLHAMTMLKHQRDSVVPDIPGKIGPLKFMKHLMENNKFNYNSDLCFVSDVLGTGSARKSATNSLLWHIGKPRPYYPGKKSGGIVITPNIAPIFNNTLRDSGTLIIKANIDKFNMGDNVVILPYEKKIVNQSDNKILAEFKLANNTINEVKAGGRINFILANSLQQKAQEVLYKTPKYITKINNTNRTYSLAQKIVGKACNKAGVIPGESILPKITTVGSQDASGPMTRSELKELACLGFTAPFVLQSFCHTAAYPNKYDKEIFDTLPKFIRSRGGVSIRPGDGIIHSWLNRMLVPDTVGTGGDSHTRFPIGISFPGGSNLVAFAAATGTMPLDMPESVLVKFCGEIQKGITIRDIVHSIPYYAIQEGLLTIDKQNKKNIFNGRIMEIEGLENLNCYQAFEFTDASAERCASACTFNHNLDTVVDYVKNNVNLLEWMIADGYGEKRTIERRITDLNEWLKNPYLLRRDNNDLDKMFHKIIEIDLNKITEPILSKPNDPDNMALLSEIPHEPINEVFIGSCMTNIEHFRIVGNILKKVDKLNAKLWIAPPTKMDKDKLEEEGYYELFRSHGINLEIPGCSLCMGNQARVADNSTVISTSTRNFPNRLGKGSNVYLASAELAIISAIYGKIPSIAEYMDAI